MTFAVNSGLAGKAGRVKTVKERAKTRKETHTHQKEGLVSEYAKNRKEIFAERADEIPGWKQTGGKCVTLGITVVTLVSLVLLFAQMFEPSLEDNQTLAIVNIVIVVIFVLETIGRLVVVGPREYFTSPQSVADFVVTALDITLIIIRFYATSATTSNRVGIVRVLRIGRLTKLTRITRLTKDVDTLLHKERGRAVTKDASGRVHSYNSGFLFSSGWAYRWGGTVLSMPEIWLQVCIFVSIATVSATMTCKATCNPDSFNYEADQCQDYCITEIDPSYSLVFMGLAAFLLGIFAQVLFDRWWQMRTQVHTLMEEVKNVAMMASSFIRQDNTRSNQMKNDIIRWALVSLYLLEKHIDGKVNYCDAIKKGWLTENEWDLIEKIERNRFVAPLQWGFDAVIQASMEDRFASTGGGGTVDDFVKIFIDLRHGCFSLLIYLNTPMPYIFVHLLTLICKINLLFTSVAAGSVIGKGYFTDVNQTPMFVAILFGYVFIICSVVMIEGLLRLHVVLSDPFGDDTCDFPWEMMMEHLETDVKTIRSLQQYKASAAQSAAKNVDVEPYKASAAQSAAKNVDVEPADRESHSQNAKATKQCTSSDLKLVMPRRTSLPGQAEAFLTEEKSAALMDVDGPPVPYRLDPLPERKKAALRDNALPIPYTLPGL